MIPVGKKNKSLLLGAAAILILLFVSFSATNGSTSSVNSLSKGSSELSNNAGHAAGDKDLLSGANINQEATAPDSETPVKHSKDKTNVVSGSDASLKSKDDSIKKADDSNIDSAGTFVESDSAASKKGAAKGSANKADEKSTTKGKSAVSANDYDYVIMVDAGSTGSRVHVYSFDTSVSPPALINEEFEMLKPGLSSFDTDATGAAASLDPLLELALAKIPKDKHKCSPVAVKATAGLRLLGKAKSDAILKEVRKHLESVYPFPVVEGDGISIMDGSDEGVYAWITTNYLLNNIGTSKRLDTAAVFDLGGGSTQIVFEPTDGTKVLEGEHKYDIEFGGRKFVLYQYSHLGYGLMQARNKVNAEVLKAEMKSNSVAKKLTALTESQVKTAVAEISIEHPCVPQGVNADNVIVELEDGNKYVVNFIPSTNDKSKASASGQCKFLTDSILQKDVECESKSCSFNGVYQPAFKDQFSSLADMYVFSYFYDRLQPIGMPDSFTLKEMNDIMTSVCAGSHLWDTYFKQKSHIKELEDEPLWCLDLNFMISLLHTGYDIPSTRELKTAKTIGGNELGWCLGASLPLLDKINWKCRVTKDF